METKKVTELVLENLDKLLLEGRVEDVKNKYPQKLWDSIDNLSSIDPSGNNKYLEWMAKMYMPTTIQWFRDNVDSRSTSWSWTIDEVPTSPTSIYWNEHKFTRRMPSFDLSSSTALELKDNIEHFHKNPSKYEIKDINQFKDLKSFNDAVEIAKQKLSRKEQKETGVEKLYEDDNFILMLPKTHKASCRYGANTRWCVTMRDRSGYFERYFSQGPIFFLVDKRRTPSRYTPKYMEDAPNYWKVAIHYQPFNGRLDQSGSRALQYARSMSKEEFVDGANVGNVKIDYWNVQDDNKKESIVAKYLAGPGKGQTQRSEVILNTLKNVMQNYTKKVMSEYYDSLGDDTEVVNKLNSLNQEREKLRSDDNRLYYKGDRLNDVLIRLNYFQDRLETDEGDDEYRNWVKEQKEQSTIFYEQIRSKRQKIQERIDEIDSEINKINEKLSNETLVFYDREKSVKIN